MHQNTWRVSNEGLSESRMRLIYGFWDYTDTLDVPTMEREYVFGHMMDILTECGIHGSAEYEQKISRPDDLNRLLRSIGIRELEASTIRSLTRHVSTVGIARDITPMDGLEITTDSPTVVTPLRIRGGGRVKETARKMTPTRRIDYSRLPHISSGRSHNRTITTVRETTEHHERANTRNRGILQEREARRQFVREIDRRGSSNASHNDTSVTRTRMRDRRVMDENQLTLIVARRSAPQPELPDDVIEINSDTDTIDLVSSSDDDDDWRIRMMQPLVEPRSDPEENVEESSSDESDDWTNAVTQPRDDGDNPPKLVPRNIMKDFQ